MQLKKLLLWITFTFSGKKAFIARNSTANFEELLDPFCHLFSLKKNLSPFREKKSITITTMVSSFAATLKVNFC